MREMLSQVLRLFRSPQSCRPRSFVPALEALDERALPTAVAFPSAAVNAQIDELTQLLNSGIKSRRQERHIEHAIHRLELEEVDALKPPRHHAPHHHHSGGEQVPLTAPEGPTVSSPPAQQIFFDENAPGGPPGR